jgi:hypothetical protein
MSAAARMKMAVLRFVAAHNLVTLIMEAGNTSETSADFYLTIRLSNEEDSHLHTHRRENIKSHKYYIEIFVQDTFHSDGTKKHE